MSRGGHVPLAFGQSDGSGLPDDKGRCPHAVFLPGMPGQIPTVRHQSADRHSQLAFGILADVYEIGSLLFLNRKRAINTVAVCFDIALIGVGIFCFLILGTVDEGSGERRAHWAKDMTNAMIFMIVFCDWAGIASVMPWTFHLNILDLRARRGSALSTDCTNGRRAAEVVPLAQQVPELKFFLYHARRGFLAQDGGLIPWPFQSPWSPEDTDFLGKNLLDFQMKCARVTVIAIEFGEDDHPNPAAQEEHTANHVYGGSPALAAEEADRDYLDLGEEQSLGDDQPDADCHTDHHVDATITNRFQKSMATHRPCNIGNQAGPSNSRPNLKRRRSWSEQETQLLLDLHAEKDTNGKKIWTYPKMMEIPQFRGRTRNALESRVYWCTKNRTESAPPEDQ
ncbi:hypothetical protein CHGG_01198 [Chaetomium globosum CBS 148.51]|uniref:Myb-like domain-containing protein n=1 Tax=Chaetomium globosum (strain ATCC 6205 / CBS 148.51 / DSM 1962 / NBRC 6347 / NRRL 1970) TaxID=306901 RepID=Q2HF06_CHAGB|nr:uncharacterized protein CHGG_01198 [Chaetomium globosum CBS 148.51]EAQ92963.1 hypothetical protein CHGG_01198 [Chaetomium globosum CBS 148.51]